MGGGGNPSSPILFSLSWGCRPPASPGPYGAVRQAQGACGYMHALYPPPRCNSGALPQLNSPDGHRAASVVALICLSSPHEVAGGTSATILCQGRIPWFNARNRPADSLTKTRRIARKGYICQQPAQEPGEAKKNRPRRGGSGINLLDSGHG